MGDRITERAEALALPWFSRSMRIGTALLAAALFVPQVFDAPTGSPASVVAVLVAWALASVAAAIVIATGVKLGSLIVRVPLSLYVYPPD